MLFSDRNVSINVQTALLEIIDPFPSSGGFVPRTVTVKEYDNLITKVELNIAKIIAEYGKIVDALTSLIQVIHSV